MAHHGNAPKVDRQTTTPFLLKLFYRQGTFHRLDEFSPHSGSPPPPHLQIYTWPTCSLRELTSLLLSALPSLLPSPAIGTRLSFRLIFPDTRDTSRHGPGRYLHKELGSVVVGSGTRSDDSSAQKDADAPPPSVERDLEGDAEKTLADARFVIGDYISCAVFPPLADGSVAAPLPPLSAGYSGRGGYGGGGRGGGGPRENGYGGHGNRSRGGRLGYEGGRTGGGLPSGEWRRGEIPGGSGGGGNGNSGGGSGSNSNGGRYGRSRGGRYPY